ncbi:MAG: bifunctional riboflavin kinase/FAD synthetase [Terriglobales bacterium]
MEVFLKLDDLPSDFGATIISVGNFDGVHLAHARVLKEIAGRGLSQRKRSLAVTFEPHPTRILRPENELRLITPIQEKLRLIAATGIDATMVLPFTNDLSEMTPQSFARDILKSRLRADEVHEGYNFRFGWKASGDADILKMFGRRMGFDVKLYPEMRVRREPVSSTHIRSLLKDGEVSRARHLLGRPFSIQSNPAHGRGYGSKYAVPTINLAAYDELVPKDGVYITSTRIGEECFDSVTNIGNRPTFGADSFAIESHLLNFHPLEMAKETAVRIYFLRRLRDEIKFPSVESLREQIGRDVRNTQHYFDRLKSQSGVALADRELKVL